VIADPFHLIKRVQALLYRQYYAPLRKRLRGEGKTKESLDLFYARWAFRKGSEKLTPKQSSRLTKILNLYPRLDQAWILKEKTRYIYQAGNRREARERLAWVIGYSKREGFFKAAKTLIRNQTGILNFFKRDKGKREVRHYPEERISQIRRVERKRGSFRKAKTLERNMLIGYQLAGLI
jgi:transposase